MSGEHKSLNGCEYFLKANEKKTEVMVFGSSIEKMLVPWPSRSDQLLQTWGLTFLIEFIFTDCMSVKLCVQHFGFVCV